MMERLAVVIDDDADERAAFRSMLEREGYDVLEAEDGLEGLDIVSGVAPFLVVLDLHMPLASGWDFLAAKSARGLAPQAKVFICSGRTVAEAPSGLPFFQKPVDRPRFLAALREACEASTESLALALAATMPS
jgi:CheY-like chemotaxis protein